MAGRGRQLKKVSTPFPSVDLILFERSPYWWIRFWNKERRQSFFRTTETVDEQRAMALLPELYQAYLQNPDANSKEEAHTVPELIDKFVAHHEGRVKRREIEFKTWDAKKCSLKTGMLRYIVEFGYLRVKELNFKKDFKQYPGWRKALGYKHSTIKLEVKIIKEFANWLFKNGFIKDGTCNIDVPRQTHEAREEEDASAKAFNEEQVSLIREELERLISEAKGAEKVKCTQVQCYFELMLAAGTRTDELFHWEFRDVKIKPSGEVLVDVRVSKTGRRNTIFMSETVTELRNLYKSKNIEVKPSTSLWIDVGTQQRWSKGFFSGRFRKVLTAVGLGKDYRMYCCRSTHITRALKRGVGTYLLGKNLGTSEVMISQFYEDIQIEHEGAALLGTAMKKPDLMIIETVKEVFVPLV